MNDKRQARIWIVIRRRALKLKKYIVYNAEKRLGAATFPNNKKHKSRFRKTKGAD